MSENKASGLLSGRRVLVVGAGSGENYKEVRGNGQAICLELARQGAIVACADKDLLAAERTVAEIKSQAGQALALQVDVSDVPSIPHLLDQAEQALGGLDGLVMSVGISNRTPLDQLEPDSWDQILNVNTRSHLFFAKHALKRMGSGSSIVFISSTASISPRGKNPSYEASKAALSAVCRAVALEGQATGVRANVVTLGLIDTPMGQAASRARPNRSSRPLPFGRQGKAEEVANVVAFLISDKASYVNATEVLVDGGLSAGVVVY